MTYPNPVGKEPCDSIELNAGELAFVRQVFVRRLNELIKFAAAKTGVRVIDLTEAFAGRRICEVRLRDAAVNFIALGRTRGTTVELSVKGLAGLGHRTFHPNVLGHQMLERVVAPVLRDALAGKLAPLPAIPDQPPEFTPSGVGAPVAPHAFPKGVRCRGDEISVTTPRSVEFVVRTIALKDLRPASTVCFHRLGDRWSSRLVAADGTAQVPVTVDDPGFGSINEVLAQQAAGAWTQFIVSRVPQPGDELEPAEADKTGFLLLLGGLGVTFLAAVAIRLYKLAKGGRGVPDNWQIWARRAAWTAVALLVIAGLASRWPPTYGSPRSSRARRR